MSIFCNIGSIVLGLVAWALPVAAMAQRKNPGPYSAASFFLCCLSLLLQLGNMVHLCGIGDFSAIDDTIGAVMLAAASLVITAAILNGLALLLHKRK